jgi:malonate decarboxylase alpha subunit
VVETVPRVDVPGDQVDFIIKADRPFYVEPLFTHVRLSFILDR